MTTIKYLIIYDVKENRNRYQLVKILEGFGIRVQKSAFEAVLSKDMYSDLISRCMRCITEEDSLRVYKVDDNPVYSSQTKISLCTSSILWM